MISVPFVPSASLPGYKQEKYLHLLHPEAHLYCRDDQLAVYFLYSCFLIAVTNTKFITWI